MADAHAALGLVSKIVQFIDFGIKIVQHLNEVNSEVDELPKTFQAAKVKLPIMIDMLHHTEQQISAGHVNLETATALKPLIDACLTEIEHLQTIVDKTLPPQKSPGWRRRLRALKSLSHDKDVDRSLTKLEGYMLLLTFHQSTKSTKDSDSTLWEAEDATSQQPPKPVFMVPFDRDEAFVGRKDILDSIDQKLNASRRCAVLSGIGGVGYGQITLMVSDLTNGRQ
jgi:N-terminal domain on NACHT_NTPase and P-loop NTPases